MLIRFNVRNFLSFSSGKGGRTEEFSMIPGNVASKTDHVYEDNKAKMLKFAAIYGANASGKSNLVKAMDFAQQTIVAGIQEGASEMYCKSRLENKNKKSYFEFEIDIDGEIYAYGFEIILSLERFTSEWLVELIDKDCEKVIFERNIEDKTFKYDGPLKEEGLHEKINVYLEDIRSDDSVLFMSAMNQNKKDLYKQYPSANIIKRIFNWFKTDLDVNYPQMPLSNYLYMSNSENVKTICKLISAFGTGIKDFKMVDISFDRVLSKLPEIVSRKIISSINKKKTQNNVENKELSLIMRTNKDFFIFTINKDGEIDCKTIQFTHNNSELPFSLLEESDGTVRLLDLLEILIAGENKTYVIDELDRCLHPSLTFKFIETFLVEAAKKKIQLIVTTHESRLMDFDLLRRDEIWFVDKNNNGESDIYSLDEFNQKFDKIIDKAYFDGRYGGVPVFNAVFPIKADK